MAFTPDGCWLPLVLLDTLAPGWFDLAQQLGCDAVVSHYRLMDAAMVAQLHTAGLRALCYTVNDADEAQRLRALGIDGLITDAVDQLAAQDHVVLD